MKASQDNGDKDVDEVTVHFKGLAKKKKAKKSKESEGEGGETISAEGEFDPSALKKKKKKKPTKAGDDEFEAKLAEAGVGEEAPTEVAVEEQDGDLEKGTGIWHHDATKPITYPLLLTRFFTIIQSKNPDLLSSTKSYKIPPPQCLREGNKKTIFSNIAEICKSKRSHDIVSG